MSTKRINIHMKTLGSQKAEKEFKKIGSSIAGVAAKYVSLTAIIYGVARGVTSSIEKYKIQEAAERKLEVAIGKRSQALLDQAAALQKSTTFADEEIIAAQALIGSFVKEEYQIKEATKATLDLAAAKGMDLTAAADLVSKTLGSSTNALSRYGIQVEGAVGSQKRLNSLTKNVANTFGGQASAQADTLSGKIENLSNSWGDLLEKLGKFAAIGDDSTGVLGALARAFDWVGSQLDPLIRKYDFFKRLQEGHDRITGKLTGSIQKQGKVVGETKTKYDEWREKALAKIETDQQEHRWSVALTEELARQNGFIAQQINVRSMQIKQTKEQIENIKKVKEVSSEVDQDFIKKADEIEERNRNLADKIEERNRNLALSFSSTLSNVLLQGHATFKSIGDAFAKMLARMAIELGSRAAVFSIFKILGFDVGSVFGGVGSVFGGFRQHGGDVARGKAYVVGEERPEVFIPDESGRIEPGVGNTITINFNAPVTDKNYVKNFVIPEITKAIRRNEFN